MSTTCVVEFDNNPSKVFYSGQLVQGTVNLVLAKPMTIRSVFIKIKGEARSSWEEGTGNSHKTYTGSEDYFNERKYLVGSEYGKHKVQIKQKL